MALQNEGGTAPYTSAKAIIEVIEQYRDKSLPTPFTADVLGRVGVSDGLIARTLQSLKLLDLIDDEGNPSETLNGLRLAKSDELPMRFADLVREAYAPIFAFVDPAKDTPERVRDAFRVYSPTGQQMRMVALFYALCEKAEIITETPGRRQATPAKPRTMRKATPPARPRVQERQGQNPHSQQHGNIPGTIIALLNELPKDGTWTNDERERFVSTFKALLDFSYKVQEKPTVDNLFATIGASGQEYFENGDDEGR